MLQDYFISCDRFLELYPDASLFQSLILWVYFSTIRVFFDRNKEFDPVLNVFLQLSDLEYSENFLRRSYITVFLFTTLGGFVKY